MTEYEGHTAGPWRLFDDDGSDAHGRLIWGCATDARFLQGYPVAIVLPDGHLAEFEANARLVAAAPALLSERDEARAQRDALAEALQFAHDALKKEWGSTSELCWPSLIEEALERARAALEKARGI